MATTLYAPQVPAVQPAFVYNKNLGEVFINFSFSAFNSFDDISTIELKIIDPNISSVDGNNIIVDWSTITGLNKNKNNYIAKYNINDLNTNQYYQVQLRFVKYNMPDAQDERSPVSQVTLIYPIDEINTTMGSISGLVGKIQNKKIVYEIGYTSSDPIASYYFEFKDKNTDKIYNSPWIKNTDLKNIDSKILTGDLNDFLPDASFDVTLYYTTVHGYNGSMVNWRPNLDYRVEETNSDITFKIEANNNLPIVTANGIDSNYALQKEVREGIWKTLFFNNTATPTSYSFFLIDDVEKYRSVYAYDFDNQTEIKQASNPIKIECEYEHILLFDENVCLPIKYNPAITGFKWVKQESITNTLGGKYPLVRVNADTDYRQFNLSGTLFCNNLGYLDYNSVDSSGKEMNTFFEDEYDLYYNNSYNLNATSLRGAETEARHIFESFLKNGKPKFFRSAEEGSMIVYLSNVSFTPNKQLGRHIYDFSATVTEICDCTEENLIKHKVTLIPGLGPLKLASPDIKDGRNDPVLVVQGGN